MPRTYEPIATVTLGSAGNTISFSSIPTTYTDLLVQGLVTYTGGGAGQEQMFYRVNGDSGSNYSQTVLYGFTSAVSSRYQGNLFPTHLGRGADSGTLINFQATFMNYANTSVFKTVLSQTAWAALMVDRAVGLWRSTSAITSVSFATTFNFASGSTLSLYGIKAA